MLPRIKPKKSFPNAITRLARAVKIGENQILTYTAFPHDVTGAIFVLQNNEINGGHVAVRNQSYGS